MTTQQTITMIVVGLVAGIPVGWFVAAILALGGIGGAGVVYGTIAVTCLIAMAMVRARLVESDQLHG
jgi:hypothetical protein